MGFIELISGSPLFIFVAVLVKFAVVYIVDRAIHEDRSVLPEKSVTFWFSEHVSPHFIFRKRSNSGTVYYINVALYNLVMYEKISILDVFHAFSC